MMKSEFLELTGFGENYVTQENYNHVEEAYLNTDETKQVFCKRFYREFNKVVTSAVSLLIRGKSLEEKESYINGQINFDEIEKIEVLLKNAFFKTFK